MKKLAILAAALAVVPTLAFAVPAFADSPGQLANGANLYKVRNTKNTTYSTAVSAACNESVKYSIEVSNTQYGALADVTAKANLANGDLSVSATNTAGATVNSNGNVQVTIPAGSKLSYVAGSTERVSLDGNTRNTEGDGVVTAAGENVGNLAGSTRIFVQFQAKVTCDTPNPETIKVCELSTKKLITINKNDFDAAKHTKDLTKCDALTETPKVLASTGPAETFAQIVGVTAIAGAISYYVASRRQNNLG